MVYLRSLCVVVAALLTACSTPSPNGEPSSPVTGRSSPIAAPTAADTGSPAASQQDPLPPRPPFVVPPTPGPSDPLAAQRPPMPAGFPVMDEARPALLDPTDATVIARWYVPLGTYDVFAFYQDRLPAADFPIEGVYPGEGVGIIRFHDGARLLQVSLTGDLDETDLVLRTDQP